MSKVSKIKRMLVKGKSALEIAKALGVSNAYVHTVKWQMNRQSKKPSKIIAAAKDMNAVLTEIKVNKAFQEAFDKHQTDLVNNPPHYKTGGIDFLDYAEAKGLTENAYLFNVVKYVSRAGRKIGADPVEDLKKAEFYIKREIERRVRA